MKPKLLLRIASILMALHTIGHTFGALSWKQTPNAAIARVINAMQANHFQFMGRWASLADFYEGYGLTMIGVLLLISLTLWAFAAETSTTLVNRLLPLFGVFLIAMSVVEFIYFFPFAAVFSLLAGMCTLIARLARKPIQIA